MNTEITLVLRSLTHTLKGKRLLLEQGIHAEVVRPPQLDEGCGYGLSVSVAHADAASEILRKNSVRVVKILRS